MQWFTKLVAASTLLLIFAGAMVTSTGSGLAVPDWPLSYGMLFPPMVAGIFYEHGHRMIAATVGLLTLVQAIWLQRRERRRFVRRLGWLSAGAVLLQGLLGGLTVIFLLPPAISISHAALAEIFLCLNVSIAFFTSIEPRSEERGARSDASPPIARVLLIVVFIQILLGALVRHLQAGLAIPDFPLSFGRIIPEFSSLGVAVNFAHRAGAVLVLLLFAVLTPTVVRSTPALRRIYGMALGILIAQIALGALTVWSGKSPVITSLHVVTGAMLLTMTLLFTLEARVSLAGAGRRPALLRDYLELSKARIVAMVLVTTAAGFALGSDSLDLILLLHTLLGTALIAAGTNALNQYLERELDGKMARTRHRPLPDHRLGDGPALIFATAVSVAGAAYLALAVNLISSLLAVFTLLSYIFVYTPLKTRTTWCTLIGAVPGAIPPMIGWAGATGRIDAGAWSLFLVMFLWQLPHFLAIGWIYREDYARAGFTILSVTDQTGSASGRQALLYGLALVPASLTPALFGLGGALYIAGGVVAGAFLVGAALRFARSRSMLTARRLFLASNMYLILLMALLVATSCSEGVALPTLYPVPSATLINQEGEALNLDGLKGKVTVYDFIFTHCAATCPVMTGSMRSLSETLESPNLRFISITVDPARDTPAVLQQYAKAAGSDRRWIFLTGDRDSIVDLSVKGFKLAAGDPGAGAEAILHSTKFVVVDAGGMIRGYYDGTDGADMKRLARDVRALLRS